MTCKDCIHYEACKDIFLQIGEIEEAAYMDDEGSHGAESECQCFKDKSRFVELPCKVGDTVYVPWKYAFTNGIASVQVEDIKIYDSKNHFMFLIDMQSNSEVFNQSFGGWKTDKSIGNTVFLTREEAEKKLEEMKK